jgi:hypothetical protein
VLTPKSGERVRLLGGVQLRIRGLCKRGEVAEAATTEARNALAAVTKGSQMHHIQRMHRSP